VVDCWGFYTPLDWLFHLQSVYHPWPRDKIVCHIFVDDGDSNGGDLHYHHYYWKNNQFWLQEGKKMKRTRLRSKDISKEVESYGIEISKKDQAELVEGQYKILLINKRPAFFYYQGKPVPTLKFLQENNILKKITVDMGAVKFVVNGADVMRPGIVEIEEGITKDEFVAVIDKNNQKPLAVGIALFDGNEMQKMTSGKVIKNIHYVGDELWRMEV